MSTLIHPPKDFPPPGRMDDEGVLLFHPQGMGGQVVEMRGRLVQYWKRWAVEVLEGDAVSGLYSWFANPDLNVYFYGEAAPTN